MGEGGGDDNEEGEYEDESEDGSVLTAKNQVGGHTDCGGWEPSRP